MLTRYHGMLIQNIINLLYVYVMLLVGQRVPKPMDFSISVSFILYFVANFNIFSVSQNSECNETYLLIESLFSASTFVCDILQCVLSVGP